MKLRVVHEKFMGDGGLYVLMPPNEKEDLSASQLATLSNRLWNAKRHFNRIVDAALEKVPVAELPRKIRFGLSRGTIYELRSASHNKREYIGFCINLASRLQSYCRDLGYIASARLMIPDESLSKHGYKKVIATKLRGFPSEVVIVDAKEYSDLDTNIQKELFGELPAHR
jgi:class 3 adenylate cyclase